MTNYETYRTQQTGQARYASQDQVGRRLYEYVANLARRVTLSSLMMLALYNAAQAHDPNAGWACSTSCGGNHCNHPWYVIRHASTAQEGIARGIADVIRSRGKFILDSAHARVHFEQARRAYIDNRSHALERMLDDRALLSIYRKTGHDERRRRLLVYTNKHRLEPLPENEFAKQRGVVTWPEPSYPRNTVRFVSR